MVAARIANMQKGWPHNASIEAVAQPYAAAQLNVSRSAVQRAAAVIKIGFPELVRPACNDRGSSVSGMDPPKSIWLRQVEARQRPRPHEGGSA